MSTEQTTQIVGNIKTDNVLLFILNDNSFPQIFKFPTKILTQDMIKSLYYIHGKYNNDENEYNDILLQLECSLDETPEYSLHTSEELNGLPISSLNSPLSITDPVTIFCYAYDNGNDSDSDTSSISSNDSYITSPDISNLENCADLLK